MCQYTIQANNTTAIVDNVFAGKELPNVLVVGFVSADQMNGSYTLNPLNMYHHDVQSICAYVDGVAIPQRPLQMDFSKFNSVEGYMSLFACFNAFGKDKTIPIPYKDWLSGYTLYGFNTTNSGGGNARGTINPPKQGVVRLEVQFKTAPTKPLYMIVMSKTANALLVDKTRQIFVE